MRPSTRAQAPADGAALVAEGLTNAEIGDRLGISPGAVGRHATLTVTKLDTRSGRGDREVVEVRERV
jgi:DNA-binding NarL/FixJ family response regulator